jgi:hypothetical protein
MTDDRTNIDQLPECLTPQGGCPACGSAFTEILRMDDSRACLICYLGHLVLVRQLESGVGKGGTFRCDVLSIDAYGAVYGYLLAGTSVRRTEFCIREVS